ncbi:MAG: Methyltransferase type 11 [Rubritepida sp.]|nr:Methyltransferase type 11 [Rubritepida sp.]
MADPRARLQELSPGQRAAFARLVAKRRAIPDPDAADVSGFVLDTAASPDHAEVKAGYRRFYNTVSAQLDRDLYGDFSFFLNYGFASDGSPELATVPLPEHYINRNSVKLVLELVGDCPIEGRRVLDVGCGRGGTAHVLKTFFKPAHVTGLDLSPNAVAFCRRAHGDANTEFIEGDAERLPFPDATFDVATNVESSHSYPNIHRFHGEIARVLRPGGHFLYTDALSLQQTQAAIGFLQHVGLDVERDRDITPNVLLSCDQIATVRVQAFDAGNDQDLVANFLATPGSQVYVDLQSGRWTYRMLKLRKRSGAPGA